jgi:AraC-like DNA-binding protein
MSTREKQETTSERLRLNDSLAVFSEKEIRLKIEIGKTYRPPYFSILILKRGRIDLKHNLSEYQVEKDSLLFILPNAVYEFSKVSADLECAGIIFNQEFLRQSGIHLSSSDILEAFAEGFQPYYSISATEIESLLQLIKHLEANLAAEESIPFNLEIKKHSFLTLFYETVSIYRQYNAAYKVKLNRPQELSINFLHLLANHFREERSVQFYADQLFVTRKHVTQTLKDTLGSTAGELIDRAVIMEAKILLRNPLNNIAQVAQELNFSDQFFFAKFFKKHTGLTPSQFRSAG